MSDNSPATIVKSAVRLNDAVRFYGFNPTRSGFINCPFHGEKTPSLRVYENDSWYCFGCHRHGTVIDFVMNLYDLSVYDACKRIAADFGVTLPTSAKPTRKDLHESAINRLQQHLKQQQEKEKQNAQKADYARLHELKAIMDDFQPDENGCLTDEQMQVIAEYADLTGRLEGGV